MTSKAAPSPPPEPRPQGASADDHPTARILQRAEPQAAHRDQPEPSSTSGSPGRTDRAAGIEAGQ